MTFTIRKEQMDAFSTAAENRFVKRMVQHLRDFPDKLKTKETKLLGEVLVIDLEVPGLSRVDSLERVCAARVGARRFRHYLSDQLDHLAASRGVEKPTPIDRLVQLEDGVLDRATSSIRHQHEETGCCLGLQESDVRDLLADDVDRLRVGA